MSDQLRRAPFTVAACALLVVMAVLAGGAARRESITVDETAHIGAGLSYIQKLDLRFNEEHPPLPKVLAALPLVLRGTRADYSNPSWAVSDSFFPAYLGEWIFGLQVATQWNDPAATLDYARFPMLLLTLLLGWAVYSCARRLGGDWAGLLCLTIYVSTPLFLAFGPLVHTDITVTLFSLLALWTFADLWQCPGRKNTAMLALALGAALLSKFTAGILFFSFLAFALSTRWRLVPGQPADKVGARAWRRVRWRATFRAVVGAAAIVYAFYFVFSLHEPISALDRLGHSAAMAPVQRLLMPPWLYLRGVAFMLASSSRSTFVLGHAYPHGVWFYFPIVFALKSPLGFLGLLAVAAAVAIVRRKSTIRLKHETHVPATPLPIVPLEFRLHWRVLWTSLLVFVAFCLVSRLDISIRHFSIPVTLLILLLAPLPRAISEMSVGAPYASKTLAAITVALAAACLFAAVRQYPFYFPYVNSLAFGHPVYEVVNDSNVDWNQSLPEVKNFMEQHGLQQVALDDYSLGDGSSVVPHSYLWDCQQPSPSDGGAWAVISANMILDAHNCLWLMQYPHEALAGGSMYAIRLPNLIPPAGSEGGPPLPAAYHQFIGETFDIRTIFIGFARHPETLPKTLEEMQSIMTSGQTSQQPNTPASQAPAP